MARRLVQVLTAAAYNLNLPGFAKGRIYQGTFKNVCVPGLNCYSCPGAVGACPIGSLQAVLGSLRHRISLYVAGFLILTGTLLGRFICGWACPFGLIQELLHKIPARKLKAGGAFRVLKYLKYIVLAVTVILIPVLLLEVNGVSEPFFCKFICPAGTLEAGLPLVLANPSLQAAVGWLFDWKALLLLLTIVASVLIYRPFCRFICPLGAIYALFNKYSVFGMNFSSASCTDCSSCAKACKLDIDPRKTPNSPECIRCGDCVKACPSSALRFGVRGGVKQGRTGRKIRSDKQIPGSQ